MLLHHFDLFGQFEGRSQQFVLGRRIVELGNQRMDRSDERADLFQFLTQFKDGRIGFHGET